MLIFHKRIGFIAICLLFGGCNSSKVNKLQIIALVKENALYSDSLDWASIEKELETVNSFKYSATVNLLLNRLRRAGDNHSFYIPHESVSPFPQFSSDHSEPTAKYMGDHLAYIRIPGFISLNDTIGSEFATQIQSLIKALDSHFIHGWIVDLRGNTGGNMYPMITGLGPLTGDGTLGYFISRKGSSPWTYQNGVSENTKVKNPYHIKDQHAKIAVLIGDSTSSSGEMTAISFIGKKNVKLFGLPSSGYTTANSVFTLTDGSNLILASSWVSDRNGIRYDKRIIPTVHVGARPPSYCIEVAKAWLVEK